MALAAIAGLQGLVFIGYAIFDVVEALRVGITGPAEVSNPAALLGLIAITVALGLGLLWVSWGWWRARSWARSPFLVAQIVLGLIGYDFSQSSEDAQRTIGQVIIVVAIVGIVLAFLPSVRRVLDEEEASGA